MPSRIDELFSPQRLRRTWNRRTWNQSADANADVDVHADGKGTASRDAADGKQNSETLPAGPQGIKAEFDRLKMLIRQRVPGKQREALDIMLDNLHEFLTKRFSQTEEESVAGETAASEAGAIPEDESISEEVAVSEDDMTAIDLSIEELMNRIEDLVEALEL